MISRRSAVSDISWPLEDKLLVTSRAKLSRELLLSCKASSDVKSKIREHMLAAIITTEWSLLPSVTKGTEKLTY
jgi:hypothetical protein